MAVPTRPVKCTPSIISARIQIRTMSTQSYGSKSVAIHRGIVKCCPSIHICEGKALKNYTFSQDQLAVLCEVSPAPTGSAPRLIKSTTAISSPSFAARWSIVVNTCALAEASNSELSMLLIQSVSSSLFSILKQLLDWVLKMLFHTNQHSHGMPLKDKTKIKL